MQMKLNRSKLLVVGALPLLALMVIGEEKSASKSTARVDGDAPKFAIKTMRGKDIKSATSFKGKVLLLDFWATWCPPCRGEIPNLVAAYDKHAGTYFEMLGVTLDGNRHVAREKVESFMTDHNMKWDQVYEGAAEVQSMFN